MNTQTLLADDNYTEAKVKDYFTLLKPRVSSLVVFTGFVGLFLAPGSIHPFIATIAIFCIALGSGAAGAINMWFDRDIDAIMSRTKSRPIPAGRMLPQNALEFGVIAASASVFIMGFAVNYTAALLLAAAILFYVFIYTIWLKRSTAQNIVIGGAAGSFPPMIGWAAVTGGIDTFSLLLFMLIFLWTPPHFWALSLYRSEDYKSAGVPMLPIVAGKKETRKQILLYTICLVFFSFLPFLLGFTGQIYGLASLLLGGYFLLQSFKLFRKYSEQQARSTFKYSILYLFLLFTCLIIDHIIVI